MSIDDKIENSKNKAQEAATSRAFDKTKQLTHLTKKETMLKTFIKLGRRGLNCFEAANRYHDYVLRTTVSDLNRDYGIKFAREWEKVPNAFGKKTDCLRYWLDESNVIKAMALLGNDKTIGDMK
jgi:hypothetical protein